MSEWYGLSAYMESIQLAICQKWKLSEDDFNRDILLKMIEGEKDVVKLYIEPKQGQEIMHNTKKTYKYWTKYIHNHINKQSKA